jgi:hypothetical protein
VEEREPQSQSSAEPAGRPPSTDAPSGADNQGKRFRFQSLSERQRGVVALAACALFIVALLVSMLSGSATRAARPCLEGAVIGDAMVVPDTSGAAHLFVATRPPIAPNLALGSERGCEALWRSDDNGITWTTVFSSTIEAPQTVAADRIGGLYLLTQRLQFPLYTAGNLYHDGSPGTNGVWMRISPQGAFDVPNVAISEMLVGKDGVLTALAENGNGGALLRSADGGITWHSVVIPHLLTVGSAALLDPLIAVAPPTYTPGQPPGLASDNGDTNWRPLGVLTNPPTETGLQAILTGNPVARVLELELVSSAAIDEDHPVARYTSIDGGYHWSRVTCGTRPAPGCAPPARWAQGSSARYVIYTGQLWVAPLGKPWIVMPPALPVRSDTVVKLLAVPSSGGDRVYLVTLTGIWRLDGTKWTSISTGLALGPPPAVIG